MLFRTALLLLFFTGTLSSHAQPFLRVNTAPESDASPIESIPIAGVGDYVPGHYLGAAAWGDFDGNGFQDLLATGISPQIINVGLGEAVQEDVRLPTTRIVAVSQVCDAETGICSLVYNRRELPLALVHADATWIDYDNDGDLDALLSGSRTEVAPFDPVTALFENQDGAFVEVSTGLAGLYASMIAWADTDNDGDSDVLLAGQNADGVPQTLFYRNDNGTFTPVAMPFPDVAFGDAAWGDYDGDGDQDLVLMGATASKAFHIFLFRNEGDGSFTEIDAGLPNLAFGVLDWGDYDNDGDLDLFITGARFGVFLLNAVAGVWRNEGGRFTQVVTGAGVFYGDAGWGDYDGDGDLDLLSTGFVRPRTSSTMQVLRNEGNGSFATTFIEGLELDGYDYGSASWFDIDSDGDLDVAYMGEDGLVRHRIFINRVLRNSAPNNLRPGSPQGLQAVREDEFVRFSWQPAADNETPTVALTYNLRVGTSPSGSEVLSALAHPITGQRRVSTKGNVGARTSWRLRLPEGTYYWSVQTIDATQAGSVFAAEQLFDGQGGGDDTVPPEAPTMLAAQALDQQVVLTWAPNSEDDLVSYRIYRGVAPDAGTVLASVPAGTEFYDDTSVVNETTYAYRITALDRSGNESTFSTTVIATPAPVLTAHAVNLPALRDGAGAWGDYDNDGDLDLVLVGNGDGVVLADIYRNDGNNTFTPINSGLPPNFRSAVAWGDYDNDGDLDLALNGDVGRIGGEVVSQIYRNDEGTFVLTDINLFDVFGGAMAWGDYDNDGDLDLLQTGNRPGPEGNSFAQAPLTILYENNGAGQLLSSSIEIPDLINGEVAWGDYDNDGDLDILMSGLLNNDFRSLVLRNDNGAFTDINAALLPGVRSHIAWVDHDSDGDLDVAIGSPNITSAFVYVNEGGLFDGTRIGFGDGLIDGMAWGDYDNDGDPDMAGFDDRTTELFRNDGGVFVNVDFDLPEGTAIPFFAWGDYDQDADLDFVLLTNLSVRLFELDYRPGNTAPETPGNLEAAIAGAAATLSWDVVVDAQTPVPALSYNLRVGTTPGGSEVMVPMSLSDGTRLVPQAGNVGPNQAWTLRNLPAGTYYWSVQALDASFAASSFAAEGTFVIEEGGLRP